MEIHPIITEQLLIKEIVMYKILKNKDGKFDLIEIASEHLIDVYETHAEAKVRYNQLKGGQAFAGWTPEFILQSVRDFYK